MTELVSPASYLSGLRSLLERIEQGQDEQIIAAVELMATTIESGGLVHLFGSGHSMLPVLEIFPRYGSFVGLHPLTDPRLFWFNVLGSFGVPEMLFLQNTEGYADVFLDGQHLSAGDVLVIFSHGGTSAVVVDSARYAKRNGLSVIAISSSETADASPRHSSGLKLADLADAVVDTGSPRSEALIDLDGLPEPVGAVTTLLATATGLALVCGVAELLVARGDPLVQSVRVEKDETTAYRRVYEAYEHSVHRRPPVTDSQS